MKKKTTLTKRLSIKKETLSNLNIAVVVGGTSGAFDCRTNTCADCFSTSCNFPCRTH